MLAEGHGSLAQSSVCFGSHREKISCGFHEGVSFICYCNEKGDDNPVIPRGEFPPRVGRIRPGTFSLRAVAEHFLGSSQAGSLGCGFCESPLRRDDAFARAGERGGSAGAARHFSCRIDFPSAAVSIGGHFLVRLSFLRQSRSASPLIPPPVSFR